MNWSNWTIIANDIFTFLITLIPRVIDLAFSNPVMGVPIVLGIIALVFGVVQKFIGGFMSSTKGSEK